MFSQNAKENFNDELSFAQLIIQKILNIFLSFIFSCFD